MGGGGLPRCLSPGVSTSRARCRHEARHLSLCRWGEACRVAPVVALPTLRSHPRWSPLWGLHGACSLWAWSCGPSRTLSPLPPHPAALSSGGVRVPLPSSPTLGGAVVCGGGGAPLSSSLCSTHVAGTTQARREYGVSHLAAVGGGGFSFGAPIPPRSGTSPAFLAGPYCPGLPPYVAVLVPASSLSSPGALVCFVLCFFFFASPPPAARLSPWLVGLSSASPHVPSPSPRCPRPFPRWVGVKGVRGGGRPRCPSSGVSTSQARRRHEARHLSLCRKGGGRAVWLRSSPFLPCIRTPGAPPAGACTARASHGHGRVVRPAPSLRCLPT